MPLDRQLQAASESGDVNIHVLQVHLSRIEPHNVIRILFALSVVVVLFFLQPVGETSLVEAWRSYDSVTVVSSPTTA